MTPKSTNQALKDLAKKKIQLELFMSFKDGATMFWHPFLNLAFKTRDGVCFLNITVHIFLLQDL